jgi:hypothetical protein
MSMHRKQKVTKQDFGPHIGNTSLVARHIRMGCYGPGLRDEMIISFVSSV